MFLLGKGDSKKLERHFGKTHMVDLSKWAKDVIHITTQQKVVSAEKDFSNQADRITCTVDSS